MKNFPNFISRIFAISTFAFGFAFLMGADLIKAAEKFISEQTRKFEKLEPDSKGYLLATSDLQEKLNSFMAPLDDSKRKGFQKNIDRLFNVLLQKIAASKTVDNASKLDKIKDLAFSPYPSELYARNAYQAVQNAVQEGGLSEHDVLVSGVLGAIGRNPQLTDNFLTMIVDFIDTGLARMVVSSTTAQQNEIAFQKFRNLKSLGKNAQASPSFLLLLGQTILRLPYSNQHIDRILLGIKEYLLSNLNTPRGLLVLIKNYVDASNANAKTKESLLDAIRQHKNAPN